MDKKEEVEQLKFLLNDVEQKIEMYNNFNFHPQFPIHSQLHHYH